MRKFILRGCFRGTLVLLAWISAWVPSSYGQSSQIVYTDSLQNGWEPWGWADLNFNNTTPAHNSTASISVTSDAWEALYLHHTAQNSAAFSAISFWVHGGSTGGQSVQVQVMSNGVSLATAVILSPLPANSWRQETVTFASLGAPSLAQFDGFWIQTRGPCPTFYVDDISLLPATAPLPTITLTSPANGSSYAAPVQIPLAASVSANGNTITKVQFYSGSTLLGEDSSSPFTQTWDISTPGNYSVFARLIYGTGSQLDSATANITVSGTSPVSISVNAQSNRRAINPLIYGTCFASASQLQQLRAPLNRWGGNSTTRYNWHLNADNKANDWYYQSIGSTDSTPGADADAFINNSKSGGAQPMISIPMVEWMPKLGPSRSKLASYSIAKYGPQTGNDWEWYSDAGNGISVTNNTRITWNDPNDANFQTNSGFQQAWVRHLTNRWGMSTNAGVLYYIMDNEHTLWHSTHRDIHPIGATMAEVRNKFFDYAGKVKDVDPNTIVCAPEEWGWNGYMYSGYDLWWADKNGWNVNNFPDRNANGKMEYMAWFLDQARQQAAATGRRLLDVFTLHIYPQGANEFGDDVSTTVQLRRNRSTRALWDTTYVDQSWINQIIRLIPRMREWVNTYYPGTQLGITEYNWGAEGHINGATAQADLFGIFGREGLDIGTRWTTPAASTPTFKAMKLYRNYDGNGSAFGDTSVAAAGPNPDNVSVFAATRSTDGALTIMVINKQLTIAAAATIAITNFHPGTLAQAWQLTGANSITRLSDATVSSKTFNATLPAQSITLFVLPAGTPPPAPFLSHAGQDGSSVHFRLNGTAGHAYVIEGSPGLGSGWSQLHTLNLTNSYADCAFPMTNQFQFYRARWDP